MSWKKKNGVTRVQKIDKVVKRRFHADLHKLEKLCHDNKLILCNYKEADDNMICVLSTNEYELGDMRKYCSSDNENYFITESGLSKLHKLQNNEDIC